MVLLSSHRMGRCMTFSILMRLLFITVILFSPAISAAGNDELFPPVDYIRSKLQQNDIVFLGTTHKKPEILEFIAELIPSLKGLGVSHVGLEIPSDQQEKIDVFMKTGDGLDDIKLHTQIDSPECWHLFKGFENPVDRMQWLSTSHTTWVCGL